ncbi:MAG: hypothetical protein JWO15_1241 [Sphingomonadales bacterium]|nr:hypothetical protein [Sphingomonadales bacterium]
MPEQRFLPLAAHVAATLDDGDAQCRIPKIIALSEKAGKLISVAPPSFRPHLHR